MLANHLMLHHCLLLLLSVFLSIRVFSNESVLRTFPSSFPGGRVMKNLPANVGDAGETRNTGSVPRLGKPTGIGNGNQLQYSCLENAVDEGTRQAAVHEVAKSQAQLNTHTHTGCSS